ncbi:hypothetical protein NB704_000645 [Pantoea ananatis]|nr:hypothetical protein [Pantoea ananatis]
MHVGQALDLLSRYDSLRNPLTSLGSYLDPELISRCLEESGTVTLRKRRLPLEMKVWCNVGMALERKESLHPIVNRLDIMLPGNRPFVAPSAVIQTRSVWEAKPSAASLPRLRSSGMALRPIRTGAT